MLVVVVIEVLDKGLTIGFTEDKENIVTFQRCPGKK